MRKSLLSREDIQLIERAGNREQLLARIASTPYESFFVGDSVEEIEERLDSHVFETEEKLCRILPGELSRDFWRWTKRWDYRNARNMARAMVAGLSWQDFASTLARRGALWNSVVEGVVSDYESAVSLLSHTFLGTLPWSELSRGWDGLAVFEHACDGAWARELEKTESQMVREYVLAWMELKDLETIERCERDSCPTEGLLFFPEREKEMREKWGPVVEREGGFWEALDWVSSRTLAMDFFGVGLFIDFMNKKERDARVLKSVAWRVW